MILFAGYPFAAVKLFAKFNGHTPTISETAILVGLAVFLAMVTASLLKDFRQFFRAVAERIRFVYGLVMALLFLLLNTLRMVFYLMTRSLLWIVILLVYCLSPIDLIPDPILPFGVMDDIGITFFAIRWGLRSLNREMGIELKRKSREVLWETRIQTSFP